MRAAGAEQGGTGIESGSGSRRRRWGRAGPFWEESVGTEMLSRRQEAGGQRSEMDLELGRAGMEEVGVSALAGLQGRSR